MRPLLIALSLSVLPFAAFAADNVVKTEHYKYNKTSASSSHYNNNRYDSNGRLIVRDTMRSPAQYEDARYQKWASMTAEERDLAKQRGDTTYNSWQEYQTTRDAQNNRNARVEQHHPDRWQGKTAEERDMIKQRNSAYERAHPNHGGHHPDKWAGKTAEQKDAIMQRNSAYERKTKFNDGYESADERRARLLKESQRRQYNETKAAIKAKAARNN